MSKEHIEKAQITMMRCTAGVVEGRNWAKTPMKTSVVRAFSA
jgi:hypothetical protein